MLSAIKIKPELHIWASGEPAVGNVEGESYLYSEGAFQLETYNRCLELIQRVVCSEDICYVSRMVTPPAPYVSV